MPLKICCYEDEKYAQFLPLTCLRPVYTLRAGIVPLYARVKRFFGDADLCLAARDQVSALLAETAREYPVNIIKRDDGDVLLLNGRIRDYGDLPQLVSQAKLSAVFRNGDQTVAVLFKEVMLQSLPMVAMQKEYQRLFDTQSIPMPSLGTTATLYDYLCDIVADIGTEIKADFAYLKAVAGDQKDVRIHDGAHIINRDDVYFESGVELFPCSVIDASEGPVYIGANTRVESQAAIYGPCYVGPESVVLAGKISASSLGHTCRVGGEVEQSVFHSFVNKYHAGFMGHSYVGPWVNFGAMTTNSDLKNNYSEIRLSINGEAVDSGSMKVGSFIGDHTKFGIGTLLNTGIGIGVCCNVFGGTLVVEKEVPSFSWGNSEKYEPYRFQKAMETVRRTVARRNRSLSEREEGLLQIVSEGALSDEGVMKF